MSLKPPHFACRIAYVPFSGQPVELGHECFRRDRHPFGVEKKQVRCSLRFLLQGLRLFLNHRYCAGRKGDGKFYGRFYGIVTEKPDSTRASHETVEWQ